MGQVKARQVKKSQVEESIARAIELYKSDKKCTLRQAAESEGLALSTVYGRLKGRQSRRKAHEVHQILSEAEERSIVRQIEDMDHRGFPMRVDHVREIALKLLDGAKGRHQQKKICARVFWLGSARLGAPGSLSFNFCIISRLEAPVQKCAPGHHGLATCTWKLQLCKFAPGHTS